MPEISDEWIECLMYAVHVSTDLFVKLLQISLTEYCSAEVIFYYRAIFLPRAFPISEHSTIDYKSSQFCWFWMQSQLNSSRLL